MKTAATYLLAFLFIFLLCPDNSAAQDIEGELKTYAALCDSCLMLKKSLSEGAAVSPDKAKSLIGKFVETGKRLKSRSMTPWQKDTYRIITERFSRSSYTEPFAAEIPRLPAMQANVIEAGENAEIIYILTDGNAGSITNAVKPEKDGRKLNFSIIASASFPHLAGSLMLAAQYNGWGGYIRGSSNFAKAESSYNCLSNGTVPDGSEFWGKGQDRLAINSLTAGAIFPIIGNLSIYAGAGTGRWTLIWMDIDSEWAKVADLSYKGIAAEAGIVAGWKFLVFSAGVTTVRFKTLQANVGVGVRF